MWRKYIRDKFGNKYADEISMQELRDFLINLYEYQGKSYAYVEGFLKFFYLLFGMSRRCEAIDQLKYIEMFQTRGTRLNMPPRDKGDKEEPIEIYTQYEIGKLEELTIGGNLYTAFMLGFYCGLRIAETFGLRWSDIDWHSSTITINKQMAYEDGCFCLKPVKTLTSERIIDMSAVLHDYLYEVLNHQIEKRKELGHGYRATEKVIDKTKKGKEIVIIGGDFINRKIENGELLTINSVKYLTKKAKEVGINFHYHALRHTHATMMASLNTPAIELMSRLGHKKYDTSLAYYVLVNALTKDKLKENLKLLTTKDKKIVTPSGGTISSALLKEIQANLAKRTPKKR